MGVVEGSDIDDPAILSVGVATEIGETDEEEGTKLHTEEEGKIDGKSVVFGLLEIELELKIEDFWEYGEITIDPNGDEDDADVDVDDASVSDCNTEVDDP